MLYVIVTLAILSWSLMIAFIIKALRDGMLKNLKSNIHFYAILVSTIFLSLKSYSLLETYL